VIYSKNTYMSSRYLRFEIIEMLQNTYLTPRLFKVKLLYFFYINNYCLTNILVNNNNKKLNILPYLINVIHSKKFTNHI